MLHGCFLFIVLRNGEKYTLKNIPINFFKREILIIIFAIKTYKFSKKIHNHSTSN